jgi:predicted nucleic acid-binding protein
MNDKAFLDTNILVYAYDQYDPQKQKKAQSLLTDGMEQENIVLSVQVLGEFFNVVTRHIISVLSIQDIDLTMVNRAIDTHKMYQISYWDSLIIAAAERAECKSILSEDLNDGQTYHGIQVSNPFKAR